jgi:hypothetical protein
MAFVSDLHEVAAAFPEMSPVRVICGSRVVGLDTVDLLLKMDVAKARYIEAGEIEVLASDPLVRDGSILERGTLHRTVHDENGR